MKVPRRFGRASALALAGALALGSVATATHTVSINFNPDPPEVGESLTITVTTNEPSSGNNLVLDVCRELVSGNPTGPYTSSAACEAATPTGGWVEIASTAASTVGGLVYTGFPTSDVADGQTVGFRYKHTPVQAGSHPNSQATVNKTFVDPAGSCDPAYTATFYRPLDADGVLNSFKNGRVIPVKVSLTDDCDDDAPVTGTTGQAVTVKLTKVALSGGTPTTDAVEEYADAGASSGNTNVMRWSEDDGFWIYNLDSKALVLKTGSTYELTIRVDGDAATEVVLLTPTK